MDVFEKSFLKCLMYSKEPFGIIDDKVFFIGKPDGSDNVNNSFICLGEAYPLIESEEISELEEYFVNLNKEKMQSWMSSIINKEVKKVKGARSGLNNVKDLYSSMQDKSVEKFIMVDVFNTYNHENKKRVEDKDDTDAYNFEDIDLSKRPSIDDIVIEDNSLKELFTANGMICFDNICYNLVRTYKRDKKNGQVIFDGKKLGLVYNCRLEELLERYKKIFTAKIKTTAKKHCQEFSEIIEQIKNSEKILKDKISSNNYFDVNESRRGEIGFSKISNDRYNVNILIDKYIIERRGKFYYFDPAKTEITLRVNNDQIMIESEPIAIEPSDYIHPFVYPDKTICFNKYKWLMNEGVNLSSYYKFVEEEDRKNMALRISNVLKKSKQVITMGYIGEKIKPVRSIDHCNCCIANNKSDAIKYAKDHGIEEWRIFENA